MNHKRWNWLLCAGMAVTLGACGNLGVKGDVSPALYDLGISEPVTGTPAILPTSIEVRAPSWLSNSAMQYRIDYQQPAQRQAFAESRWASPPAEMLERSLRRAFTTTLAAPTTGAITPGNGCRLRVELDEFTQVFDTPQSSYASIVARVELLPARGDSAVARQLLSIRETASSLDAKGGVSAHQRASVRLAHELAVWLTSLEPALRQNPSVARTCIR
ncbi:ABC-type transport auxiliary lipoprotein family protein [Aromatoleum diolicum]|uniref:ABC-type transport auxiliary lipoprotein component domain-containing protein n=1 Tax=Aromatoleum diolicum TaxID=75796 RepID=A0ABX1QAG7_9RHOO|nr:ABC-type transport auxiliary lipoprotein family protein [Aromatoleum diolicum]NMG74110.1 hypothetical protein [Aromatoleum diolicum]